MNPYKSCRFLSCVCVFKAGGGYIIYSCKNSACKVRFTPSRSLESHFCIEVTLFLIPMHIPWFILQKKDWHKSRDYLSVWACVRVAREFVCTVGARDKISVGTHNTVNKAKHKLGPVSIGSDFVLSASTFHTHPMNLWSLTLTALKVLCTQMSWIDTRGHFFFPMVCSHLAIAALSVVNIRNSAASELFAY